MIFLYSTQVRKRHPTLWLYSFAEQYADYVLKAKLESITDKVINNQGSKYSIETMSYLDEDVLEDFCKGAEWLKQKTIDMSKETKVFLIRWLILAVISLTITYLIK